MYQAHITISIDARAAWVSIVDSQGNVVARCGHTHRSRQPANSIDAIPAEFFADRCADRMLRRFNGRDHGADSALPHAPAAGDEPATGRIGLGDDCTP